MGGFEFNRRDYVQPKPAEPPPGPSFSITGPLILLVVVVVGGLVAYKFLKSGVWAEAGNANAQVAQISQRLDGIENRLNQLERRRRPSAPEPAPAAPKQEPDKASSRPSPPPAQTNYRFYPAPEPRPATSSPPQSSSEGSQVSQQQHKELESLRSDVTSTREEWQATTDRLGNVVGELSTQRDEITRHGETLEQLQAHFQHNSVPFTLRKGADAKRVGPVSLQLENTDRKTQRYTLRLLLDDKVVEVKDRALNEAIQFYGSGGKVLLELVVSQIGKDAVSGRLALPQPTASGSR